MVCCVEEVNHLHFTTQQRTMCSNGATFEWDDVCKNKSIYKFTQQNAYNSYEQTADKIGAHIFCVLTPMRSINAIWCISDCLEAWRSDWMDVLKEFDILTSREGASRMRKMSIISKYNDNGIAISQKN